ncbi:hypothetical protein BCV69DRAFT_279964 [Microstroma glucosiphilum]|uniref:Endosomal/vacuolar adapter protein YPT35 n=1 Tax=Pseudomicrostroma glucosiphilum TaxID=1684307 RepID=A0A316UJD9_9BASI|nr:hypothetical protein BCV69DRAFT_279964 [Pseudomicrostroma glucosiphilum]PWN24063.1 hypothetical protein BCV69DRAFT_279964 [Pseudomicrostroma glucosiphilum]
MDSLAADLREAASDLLDVPANRQARTPKRQTQVNDRPQRLSPTVSEATGLPSAKESSKLVLLDANGEEYKDRREGSRAVIPGIEDSPQLEEARAEVSQEVDSGPPWMTSSSDGPSASERFASLHSSTPPLRPSSAGGSREALRSRSRTSASATKSQSNLFQRATASTPGVGNSRLDVWLNEKGERVVNGKVVGRLTLAGTKTGRSRWEGDSGSQGLDLSLSERGSLDVPSWDSNRGGESLEEPSISTPRGHTIDLPISDFDHSRHGSHTKSITPEFFMQSFPNLSPGQTEPAKPVMIIDRSRADMPTFSSSGSDVVDSFHDANEDAQSDLASLPGSLEDSPASLQRVAQISPADTSMLRMPGMSLGYRRMGDLRSNLALLHQNKSAAPLEHAGEDMSGPGTDGSGQQVPEDGRILSPPTAESPSVATEPGPLTFDATTQGIAWEPWERTAGPLSPSRTRTSASLTGDRPLLERAASLFSTQLVTPPAEREEGGTSPEPSRYPFASLDEPSPWAEAHRNDSPQALVSSTTAAEDPQSGDDGDAASLYSLPASSITGSNSDAASRRPSLRRRTSSNASVLSTHDSSASPSSSPRRPRRPRSMSSETFTRDVVVRAWTEVGSRTRGYVTFEVVLLTAQSGLTIRAHRRYSSFVALRRQLAVEAPAFAEQLPALPPKDLIHKFSPKHLEVRRKALSTWLQLVLLDPRWGGRKAAREWLVGAE